MLATRSPVCLAAGILLAGFAYSPAIAAPPVVQSLIRVTTDSAGNQTFGQVSDLQLGTISADGRYVVFESQARGLVPEDTNDLSDIFLKDLVTGQTTLISRSTAGVPGNDASYEPSISADGLTIMFNSWATNFISNDTNRAKDVFTYSLRYGNTTLTSANSNGVEGNDVSWSIFSHSLSYSGTYVTFVSRATNLSGLDTNGRWDIFYRDRRWGTTTCVSTSQTGERGNGDSDHPSITYDGRYVLFESDANNLVPNDNNGVRDVFVKDVQTGNITLISSDSSGVPGNADSHYGSISSNGKFAVFQSLATNFSSNVNPNNWNIYIKNLDTGELTLLSQGYAGDAANGDSLKPSLNDNGRYVVFHSSASNLVPGDYNKKFDVFVLDRNTGQMVLASQRPNGVQGNNQSIRATLSADGTRVIFQSYANNLVDGDTNGSSDMFVATIAW